MLCNNHAAPKMLCGNCGATTSPELDRCSRCRTRLRASHFGEAGSRASHLDSTAGTQEQLHFDPDGVTQAQAPQSQSQEPATTAAGLDRELTRLSSGHTGNSPTPIVTTPGVHVLQPGQHFGSRYTIIRLLGSGGMAAVYQAWDETLGTAVALKLIRVNAGTPEIELRQLEDRFKRELKLARQVTHPNVVRIHDLGEVESTLYLTMSTISVLLDSVSRLPPIVNVSGGH